MAAREDDDETTVESSLEELIAKKAAERPLEGEDDDDVLDLDLGREEQAGPDALVVKALPKQDNEFTCKRCFLVKHRSQLADKRKGVCRDCA